MPDSTDWPLIEQTLHTLSVAVQGRNAEVVMWTAQRIAKLAASPKAKKRGRKYQEVTLKTGQRVKLYRDRIEALEE